MTQLADTSWSPSKAQQIVGNKEVANVARQSLAWIVSERLNNVPAQYHNEVMQKAVELDTVITKFEQEGVAERIAVLEAELAQVCIDGEAAEAAFQNAKNKELVVRNADNDRLNRYNSATANLTNLKNEPLPTFHNDRHVARKKQRIADATAEVDAALADMNAHPMAIPQAVQAKMDAEQRVNQLAARARGLRREIATLRGEPVEDATGSSTGLGGLR